MATLHLRVIASLSFGLLVATAAPVAAAPDDASADTAARKPAEPQWKIDLRREALYREGQVLIQQGRFQEALDKLREVNQIRSHPRVLLWMGFPEEQLGHLLKAKAIYTQAQQDAQAAKLKSEEQDAERALAALAPKIPRLVIHLALREGAEVSLDSAKVPFQKEGWEVDPGKHAVSVSWPKRPPFQTEVIAKVGEVSTVNVVVPEEKQAPKPPPKPPAPVVETASSGPPGEMLALFISGGIGIATGATLLGVGVSQRNGGMTRAGIAASIVGAGLGVGGLVWYVTTPSGATPSDPEARSHIPIGKNAPRSRLALGAPIDVQIAPSPLGFWAGVSGRF
jgi:hypothetical protein